MKKKYRIIKLQDGLYRYYYVQKLFHLFWFIPLWFKHQDDSREGDFTYKKEAEDFISACIEEDGLLERKKRNKKTVVGYGREYEQVQDTKSGKETL